MNMHKTIWKYKLDEAPGIRKSFTMPISAEVVRVEVQNRAICLWAVVLPEQKEIRERLFYFSGTGHPIPLKDKYVGSCTEGDFEWHVWEVL